MAKRQGVRKIDSSSVMGDDSYVSARPIPYDAVRKSLQMKEDSSNLEKSDYVCQLIVDALIEWNWVDYDGNPLPLPKTVEELSETLNTFEVQFLTQELIGSEARSKN